jgi:hypothetical protein
MRRVRLPWFACFTCGFAVLAIAANARAALVFESRPPGSAGGGQSIGTNVFPGHTFRFLERTEVTALGAYVSTFSTQSVFAGLYRLGTTNSNPDVVNDSNLLGTTLLLVPGGTTNVTGALSSPLTLEPGWYSFITGTGRHGASAGSFSVTLPNTGTAASPQAWSLPYTMNATTNARTFSATTIRFFAEGQTLPPLPPTPGAFLMETARPAARWSQQNSSVNANFFWGTRFDVTDPTHVYEASSWLSNGSGGPIFAAIVALASPTANPLPITHPSFASTIVASTLINVGTPSEEYAGDFGGLKLQPGSYALIFGSGMFGATGTAQIMQVNDQILKPGSLVWGGSFWANSSTNFRMSLKGIVVPEPAGIVHLA